jgi:hypothetical protein
MVAVKETAMRSASAVGAPPERAQVPATRSFDGLRLFARFAFMPNHLGYCGADVNSEILAYLRADAADAGLARHLRTFTGAYPYLQLIAASNGIADPFDPRVVEAYWIGNDLLERVDWALYARHLHERFRHRVKPGALDLLVRKPPAGARAHHAFHVFDVSFRAGLPHGDAALDLCRIGWGTITAVEPGAFVVSARPLVIQDGRLALGEPQAQRVLRALGGDACVDGAPGEVLAFHWRWACQVLRPGQVDALDRYTRGMIALANQTF